MIQLFKPYVCKAAKENVARVLDSGWLGMGPECELFEKEFAEYIGCKHAISMNSATEALRIALHAGKPYTKSYVLTTPNTFVATNHVILQEGLIPLFVDIDPNTGAPSVVDIQTQLLLRHKSIAALMLVYYGGDTYKVQDIKDICREFNIMFIEDAAHAAGAEYDGKKIGRDSQAACFSFHAVKNLATGDGGMLVTNSDEIDAKARRLRWFGIDKSTAERTKERQYGWEYDVQSLGWKSHMNDIAAAIGRGQLTMLDEYNSKREELYKRYMRNLYGKNIRTLWRDPRSRSSNHLFVVRFEDAESKRRAIERLTANEIIHGYHYKPNYLYAPYKPYVHGRSFPGMEEFYATALTLPMHPFLRDCDVDKICEVILDEGQTQGSAEQEVYCLCGGKCVPIPGKITP